jgi:hypothetical protein
LEDCHHERSEGSVVCPLRQKSRFLAPKQGARKDNWAVRTLFPGGAHVVTLMSADSLSPLVFLSTPGAS